MGMKGLDKIRRMRECKTKVINTDEKKQKKQQKSTYKKKKSKYTKLVLIFRNTNMANNMKKTKVLSGVWGNAYISAQITLTE